MNINNTDFNFVRGDTFAFKFLIKTEESPINTNDIDTLYITCKKGTDNISETIFQKNLEDVTIENGYCHVVFEPKDTQKLNYGRYYFDIEITLKSGYRKTKLYTFTLTEETTLHGGNDNGN